MLILDLSYFITTVNENKNTTSEMVSTALCRRRGRMAEKSIEFTR